MNLFWLFDIDFESYIKRQCILSIDRKVFECYESLEDNNNRFDNWSDRLNWIKNTKVINVAIQDRTGKWSQDFCDDLDVENFEFQ